MTAPHIWEMIGLALAFSVPVVLIGALVIKLAQSWSLAVSMVALVLIPTVATFTGVLMPAASWSTTASRASASCW